MVCDLIDAMFSVVHMPGVAMVKLRSSRLHQGGNSQDRSSWTCNNPTALGIQRHTQTYQTLQLFIYTHVSFFYPNQVDSVCSWTGKLLASPNQHIQHSHTDHACRGYLGLTLGATLSSHKAHNFQTVNKLRRSSTMGALCGKQSKDDNFAGQGRTLSAAPPQAPTAPLPANRRVIGGPGRTLGEGLSPVGDDPRAAARKAAEV